MDYQSTVGDGERNQETHGSIHKKILVKHCCWWKELN